MRATRWMGVGFVVALFGVFGAIRVAVALDPCNSKVPNSATACIDAVTNPTCETFTAGNCPPVGIYDIKNLSTQCVPTGGNQQVLCVVKAVLCATQYKCVKKPINPDDPASLEKCVKGGQVVDDEGKPVVTYANAAVAQSCLAPTPGPGALPTEK
jgi:hypothetical protein